MDFKKGYRDTFQHLWHHFVRQTCSAVFNSLYGKLKCFSFEVLPLKSPCPELVQVVWQYTCDTLTPVLVALFSCVLWPLRPPVRISCFADLSDFISLFNRLVNDSLAALPGSGYDLEGSGAVRLVSCQRACKICRSKSAVGVSSQGGSLDLGETMWPLGIPSYTAFFLGE